MEADFRKYELGNRAVVLAEHLPHARTVSVGVWIPFGARLEAGATLGSAHMIEHMVFKGTRDMTPLDIAIAFESVGGSFNAASTRETTRLYCRVLTDHLPLAVKLLCDMALESTFPPDEYEREQRVVLEEIKANMDVPEDLAHDLFYEDFFPGHGLGNNILGTEESVSGISRDAIFATYKKYYRPAHLIVTIAGNLGNLDVAAIVENALGQDTAEPCAVLETPPPPESIQSRVNLVAQDIHQAQLYFGFPGIEYDSPDRYPYTALDMILGAGMSGRLFQEVREKRGLVYDVSSENVNYTDTGVFYVCAGAMAENMLEVLDVSLAELVKVRDGDLREDELARVKEMYRAGMEMSYESVVARMARLARSQLYFGRYVTDEELLDNMAAVTIDDVAAAAGRVFRRDPLVLTALGPFGGKAGGEIKKKIVDVLNKL